MKVMVYLLQGVVLYFAVVHHWSYSSSGSSSRSTVC